MTPGREADAATAASGRSVRTRIERTMHDLAYIAAGLVFFAVAAGYAALCDRF
jgi:hypothetical protein